MPGEAETVVPMPAETKSASRPGVADPAPLGLAGFALTTFILSAHNAGWAQSFTWLGLACFYGGLAQLLAGMWEFKRNNTFAATAFSTYGAFWMSLAMLVLLEMLGALPKDFNMANSLGWFLAGFFIFNFYMTIIALAVNTTVFSVFFLLSITEALLFIGQFSTGGQGWIKAGGYFGVFTAAAAFYGSFANCFNATVGKTVIPVGPALLKF